jgi:hypothetical protein
MTNTKNSIIKNYGLYWDKDLVKWKGIRDTRLMGYYGNDKENNKMCFDKQIGVYILYLDYRLVYVGKAEKSLFSRLNNHKVSRNKSGRWNQFSWFGVKEVIDKSLDKKSKPITAENSEIIKSLEALLIAASEPGLNKQRGQWGNAVRYYQIIPVDYQTEKEKLEDIQEKLKKLLDRK